MTGTVARQTALPATACQLQKCFVSDTFYLLSMFKYLLPSSLTFYLVRRIPPSNHFAPFQYLINSILSQSLMLARKVTLPLHPLQLPTV